MGNAVMEPEKARVFCGANDIEVSAGISIADVLSTRRDELNVPANPQILVGGKPVDSSYLLKANDHVEVIQPTGRKG